MEKTATICLLAALILTSYVSAAPTRLVYSPEAGATWTIKSKTVAKIPVSGTKVIELSYDMICDGASGDNFNMRMHVPAVTLTNGQVMGPVDATFKLSPTGEVTGLMSPQMSDPQVGPVLKNVGLLFPKLPGAAVNPGASWTAREVFYLPPSAKKSIRAQAPKTPDKVRLDATFKFIKVDGKGAQVAATLKNAPGEAIRVNFSGSGYHKVDKGYGTGASFGGEIKVRKLFMWITVPITVSSWLEK